MTAMKLNRFDEEGRPAYDNLRPPVNIFKELTKKTLVTPNDE